MRPSRSRPTPGCRRAGSCPSRDTCRPSSGARRLSRRRSVAGPPARARPQRSGYRVGRHGGDRGQSAAAEAAAGCSVGGASTGAALAAGCDDVRSTARGTGVAGFAVANAARGLTASSDDRRRCRGSPSSGGVTAGEAVAGARAAAGAGGADNSDGIGAGSPEEEGRAPVRRRDGPAFCGQRDSCGGRTGPQHSRRRRWSGPRPSRGRRDRSRRDVSGR